MSWGREAAKPALAQDKKGPVYEVSGKLYKEENKINGVTVKYNEPDDARIPQLSWRLYVFKDGQLQDEPLRIHRQSVYRIGRDDKVNDIHIAHPSCSKQHAALQFRVRETMDDDAMPTFIIKPYIMDLESSNGSFINNVKIEPARFYELRAKDTLRFGFSTREYTLLHADM